MTKQQRRERDFIFLKAVNDNLMTQVMVTDVISVTPLPDKRLINNPLIAKCGYMINENWHWQTPGLDKLTARELLKVCKLVHVIKE